MNRRKLLAVGALACAVVLFVTLAYRGRDQGTKKPSHIFLIVYDALRADHLGCYGYAKPVSPCIDSFAKGGCLFENAVSLSSWTKPSLATVFASLSPADHEIGYLKSKLPGSCTVLAAELQRAGYSTYGFSFNAMISARFGFDRGFTVFENIPLRRNRSSTLQILQRAADCVKADERQFFFIHVVGPHGPYIAPREARQQILRRANPAVDQRQRAPGGPDMWYRFDSPEELEYLKSLYDAKILAEDRMLGSFLQLLDKAGLLERSLIVFTSDHGEAFYEHRAMEHGNNLFHEEIHVPLIVRGPGIPESRRTDIVGLHDIAPTILSAAGCTPPADFQGTDLFADPPENRIFRLREFSEVPQDREWYGIITSGVKAFWDAKGDEHYYFSDWRNDAFQKNEASEKTEELQKLKRLGTAERSLDSEQSELDEKTVDQLKSLGYL